MKRPLHILHLEDDPHDAELIQAMLEADGIVCEVTRVETEADFVTRIDEGKPDLILTDYTLPSFDGLSALAIARDKCPDVPFLFVSGTLGEEVAVEALKGGAVDYVLKERLSRIAPSVRRALREAEEIRERKWAEEELYKVNRALKALSECTQAVIQTTDETALLNEICRIIVEVGGYQMAWVGFAENDERKSIRPAALAGGDRGYLEALDLSWGAAGAGGGIVGKTIRTGEISICLDIMSDPDFSRCRDAAMERGYASAVSIPMVSGSAPFGALSIYAKRPDAFNSEKLRMLKQLVENLTYGILALRTGIERRRAEAALRENFAQLSRKNRYEAIVSRVTRSVHRSIDLQEVLENAVDSLNENIEKVKHVLIYIAEGSEAVVRAQRNCPEWYIERAGRIPYPRGLTWKVILEGKSVHCADIDLDRAMGQAGRETEIKSYLSMPIFFEGKAVGTLHITSVYRNNFDEDEIKLLELVAQQIETAISNAQQAEALKKALSEVEELKNRLQAENIYLQEEIKTEYNFEEIIGESQLLKKLLVDLEKVAPTDAAVLILGETGTGKELIARAIHNLSHRRDRPLVKVNCGAISAGLVESELFGHEKGAFTGAVQQRIGRFEIADEGTIFLDEVGELPPETQVKLLRVLQEGEFERVGSSTPIKVNVRIIAATNKRLKEEIKSGSFRSDLFYRLSVFPLTVPSLKERKSDIPILANFFLAKFSKNMGKRIDGIADSSMERLMNYSWPGNIRELQNVIERAVVLAREPVIRIDESLEERTAPEDAGAPESGTLEDVERAHIVRVLEDTNWVVHGKNGAALILGMNPDTLRSRMKKLGIKRPGRDF